MSAKAKGTQREHKTRRRLEAVGYRCTRAAGSMGEWDLVAVSRSEVLLVQVKSNAWPGSVEMESMTMFPTPPGVRREVWRWDDRARAPRIREHTSEGWKERAG